MVDSLRSSALTFGFWAYRLVILNIYFIIFTVLGLIIFGALPATIAVYQLIHERSNANPWQMFKVFLDIYKSNMVKSIPLTLILLALIISGSYALFLMDANLDLLEFSQYIVLLISFMMLSFMSIAILTFSLALNLKLSLRLIDNLKLTLTFMVTKFYIPLIIVVLDSLLIFIYMNQGMLFYAIGIPSFLTVSMLTLEQFFFPTLKKLQEKQKE
ncbi:DUF624 domain-containing protein [Vallitalea pronyensis]|uniref:DUF624 domain-containing protein n=1 Tax=Vallitalea pronyensis TaxID=1348613 RepID=A0A8J8MIU8_9FIRM|nr:DUF624 domain-containing protein [Vallitalea pronyensis]QUI22083.1 DUF624 domain-containing protein [Vallitalea pronyensis]